MGVVGSKIKLKDDKVMLTGLDPERLDNGSCTPPAIAGTHTLKSCNQFCAKYLDCLDPKIHIDTYAVQSLTMLQKYQQVNM